ATARHRTAATRPTARRYRSVNGISAGASAPSFGSAPGASCSGASSSGGEFGWLITSSLTTRRTTPGCSVDSASMSTLNTAEVARLAALARIDLTPEETERLTGELDVIV